MKKTHSFLSVLLISIFITSCSPTVIIRDNDSQVGSGVRSSHTKQNRQLDDIALNGKVYSALWQQNAGEFRALCYQAFNLATEIVKQKTSLSHLRPIAIVADIDETILDNSPYAVTQAINGKEFDSNSWLEWTSKGEAIAYPGSVDFFTYAASQNVTVFYISNRNENDKPGTIENLRKLGFPFADESHVLVMKDTSDKAERRKQVLKDYEVFMYLGDNLNDFSDVFYKKSQNQRNHLVDELANEFGSTFIVLPNSGYGDWESALPGYNSNLTPTEKDDVFIKNVKGY